MFPHSVLLLRVYLFSYCMVFWSHGVPLQAVVHDIFSIYAGVDAVNSLPRKHISEF